MLLNALRKKKILSDIKKSGLEAVELFLSSRILNNLKGIIKTCKKFSLKFAVHAPNDELQPNKLAEFVEAVNSEIVVFHNIYWEDEWSTIISNFKNIKAKLCVENTYSVHEPLKFIRRYGLGSCLDLEHLQRECAGVYEEEFIPVIKQASHIHLSGYFYGSQLWHTHIHHSPEHNLFMLNLLKKAGYSGFVVSEAKCSQQIYEEFKKLNDFYQKYLKLSE